MHIFRNSAASLVSCSLQTDSKPCAARRLCAVLTSTASRAVDV